jgi:PAS domain S-box-containing protein
MRLTIERKIFVGFGIALLILLVIGVAAYRSIVTLHETTRIESPHQRLAEADDARGRAVAVIGLGTLLALVFVGRAIAVINRDIAERRSTEQALRESEAQHRLLAENATDMISRQSPEGIFLYVSPASARITGHTPDELVGTFVFDLYHPDERARLVFRHASAVETGAMQMDIYRVRRKDGEYLWVESNVRGVVRPERGVVTELQASWRDVSDRKRAEEEVRESERRLFQFLEALPVGVFVIDSHGKPYYANKAAQQMLGGGISPDDARTVGQLAEVFPAYVSGTAEPYPMARTPLDRALSGENALVDDMEIRRPDRVVPLEVRAVPILDRRGQVAYAVGVFTDITERRAVERMKDEFVSTVSHELRTPLTSIRGALGLLSGGLLGPLPEQGQRMLDIAVTNTDRLIRLINEILDIERMESGTIVIRMQDCDVGPLIIQAAEEIKAMAEGAGVTITVTPVSARVWADPDRILQTITNLLSNAIKFSEQGGVVTLSGKREAGDVLVQVADQGRGIPPDKLETIFERFRQVDASDSRQKGGTGLGLAISRSIVQQHGGQIWAESTRGAGSVFSFTLPLYTGESAPSQPAGGSRA